MSRSLTDPLSKGGGWSSFPGFPRGWETPIMGDFCRDAISRLGPKASHRGAIGGQWGPRRQESYKVKGAWLLDIGMC